MYPPPQYYNMNYYGYTPFSHYPYGYYYHYNNYHNHHYYFTQMHFQGFPTPPPTEMIYYGTYVQGPFTPPFSCPTFNVNYPVEIRHFSPNSVNGYRATTPYHEVTSRSNISTSAFLSAAVSGPSKAPSTSEIRPTNFQNKIDMSPSEQIQNEIILILKEINRENLQMEIEKLRYMITDEYLLWFTKHLISNLINDEYNFYTLISDLLDYFDNKEFNNLMLMEIYRIIKILLKSDRSEENYRKMNNLGQLLGIITLSRNKPILFDDIDLKSVLSDATKGGPKELDFIVPFISKILESCANSKIFQPKCPWTKLMLKRLVEIQKSPNLSQFSKDILDVLFKTLKVDVDDMKPKSE